jgi:hypothetical protein
MINIFRIAFLLLCLMAWIGHYLRTLGDFVVLGMVCLYAMAASFVLAGLAIGLILLARWWTRVPFSTRRSCWAMGLICWSLRSLCPLKHQLDIADWVVEWGKVEAQWLRDKGLRPEHRAKRRRAFWS